MENNEIIYLCMVIFTCYGFNLAQGLRAAINRGDTVRITPKILCFVFCISVSIIAINIMIDSPFSSLIISTCTNNDFSICYDLVLKTKLTIQQNF